MLCDSPSPMVVGASVHATRVRQIAIVGDDCDDGSWLGASSEAASM